MDYENTNPIFSCGETSVPSTLAATLTQTQAHEGGQLVAKKKPPTKTVRVHEDVAQMVDTCSAAEGVSAPEWLSELLRPILRERLPGAVEKLLRMGDEPPKRRRPARG